MKLSKGRGVKGKEIFPDLNDDFGQSRDKVGERLGISGTRNLHFKPISPTPPYPYYLDI